ncbi:hypothetical protein INT46_002840 [Mucor plumbeus]|uniref:Uncharacterized protein n=1 Tax=Mucor plumbeus TaxID=97098 RepID=A0A8H7V484_9FUNG|nr:hypothetical protein INT46_002840 [Mucor plumbeus]
MPCPSCNSSNIGIEDNLTVCYLCGIVINDAVFETNDFSYTQTNVKQIEQNQSGKHKRAIESVDRIATYFRIPENFATQAKNIIQEHSDDLPNRFPLETALFVVYFAAREWMLPWSINDLIENFPVPVDKAKVQRVNFIFVQKSFKYKMVQFELSQDTFDSFLDLILPGVAKQYGGTIKMSKSTSVKLKQTTKSLISLGDIYGLNTGKKSRPTIIATAIISFAYLGIYNKSNSLKSVKKSIYIGRRFSSFKRYFPSNSKILKMRMHDYIDFLLACAQNIPWIDNPEKRYTHYYLKDILDLFGKKDKDTDPLLTLSSDQYSTALIKKNDALSKVYKDMFDSVQKHLDSNTIPEDQHSLEFSLFQLIDFGYEKSHLINWSEKSIRGMADSLIFRAKYGTEVNQELDMNRRELDENDMLDDEIDIYIR